MWSCGGGSMNPGVHWAISWMSPAQLLWNQHTLPYLSPLRTGDLSPSAPRSLHPWLLPGHWAEPGSPGLPVAGCILLMPPSHSQPH
ncbi:hypothetical protein FKM82_006909 [Ascaphus truei]